MKGIDEKELMKKLIKNDSLFTNVHVINQYFDIVPDNKKHYGVNIDFQDLKELRLDFMNELLDSIVDWVYSSEKYIQLKQNAMTDGKSDGAASSEIQRKARDKFRKSDGEDLLIQGQLGELLLFHFLQRYEKAVPLLRKMKITTSSKHERFGADAIHYKVENGKNVIVLGEAKTYTTKYRFAQAFEDALESILTTYDLHREEMRLYVHEDFLEDDLNEVAEAYLKNKLTKPEVHLVSIIVYNETNKVNFTDEDDIRKQVEKIIEDRYKQFDNSKVDINNNPILKRITYIVFPIWELDKFAKEFQKKL